MKNKKRFGVCMTVLAAAGVLGATVYGFGNTTEPETQEGRITLGSSIDVDSGKKLDGVTAVAAAAEEIEEIPIQEDAAETLPNIKKVAQDVMPAIVAITNKSKEEVSFFGRRYEADSESTGSGIIVGKSKDELLIATNNHVVENADDLTVCFTVDMDDEEDDDKKLVEAQIKGTDASMDLAVVAVDLEDIDEEVAEKIGIVQLGSSSDVEVGEWVVAIGNALGYGQSVTTGIVSALDREVTVETDDGTVTNNMIQTDAAINFGNSGGALLDLEGRLIGINSAKAAVSGVEGMGYAIPIDTAKPIIEELMNQTTRSKVDADKAGALGVTVTDISSEAKQLYNVPAGALVYTVTDDGGADAAGIKEGDIITKLDQTKISSKAQLLDRMKYYEAGETVTVTVMRFEDNAYTEQQFDVILGKKSDIDEEQQNQEQNVQPYYDDEDTYGYDDGYGIEDFFGRFGF